LATNRRVVVTGIGPVSPVGTGVDDFWTGLTSGRNGIRLITAFETDDLPVKVAGEVPGFDPSPWLDPKEIRRTDRFVHFGVSSAALAWEDAGQPEVPSERAGVIFATGIGGIETLLTQHSVLLEKGNAGFTIATPVGLVNEDAAAIFVRGDAGSRGLRRAWCGPGKTQSWRAFAHP